MRKNLPTVLLTIGDPCSSAPELAVKAALDAKVRRNCRPVVIGSPEIIREALHRISANPNVEYITEESLRGNQWPAPDSLHVFRCGELSPREYEKGTPNAVCGRHSVDVSRAAADMALSGLCRAICSAPTSKISLRLAGFSYGGVSDVFREAAGREDCENMLVLDRIRLLCATTHVALCDVAGLLRHDRIVRLGLVLNKALVGLFRVARPVIGIAALNPHAGDGGRFGSEETGVIGRAIEDVRRRGITVRGPIPGDYVVPSIRRGDLHGAVMMYHDQAYAPVKAVGLFKPATLLLGLPFIRTSVAHGTVFGKAMTGTADPVGMINACLIAARLANKKSGGVRAF